MRGERGDGVEQQKVGKAVVVVCHDRHSSGRARWRVADKITGKTHFQCPIASVTTADVQAWLDARKMAPNNARNFQQALCGLFAFAETRGYIVMGSNPVGGTDRVRIRGWGEAPAVSRSREVPEKYFGGLCRSSLPGNQPAFLTCSHAVFRIAKQRLQLTRKGTHREPTPSQDSTAAEPADTISVVKLVVCDRHHQLGNPRPQDLSGGAHSPLVNNGCRTGKECGRGPDTDAHHRATPGCRAGHSWPLRVH